MATLKCASTKNVYGSMRYAVGKSNERPAAPPVIVGPEHFSSPLAWAGWTQHESKNSKGRNKNTAYLSVLSFHPDELDGNNPEDVQLALAVAGAYCERVAPNSPYALVPHNDKDHLHVHIIIGNIDLKTGHPIAGSKLGRTVSMRKESDAVLKEYGLQVLDGPAPVRKSKAARAAEKRGELVSAFDENGNMTPLTHITREAHLQNMALNVLADVRCTSLEKVQEIAPEYGMTLRIKSDKNPENPGLTWGLVDENGKTLRVPGPDGKTISCAAKGRDLGKLFMAPHVLDVVAEHALREQKQREMDRMTEELMNEQLAFADADENESKENDYAGYVGDETGTEAAGEELAAEAGEHAQDGDAEPAEGGVGYAAAVGTGTGEAGVGYAAEAGEHSQDGDAEPAEGGTAEGAAGDGVEVDPAGVLDVPRVGTGNRGGKGRTGRGVRKRGDYEPDGY